MGREPITCASYPHNLAINKYQLSLSILYSNTLDNDFKWAKKTLKWKKNESPYMWPSVHRDKLDTISKFNWLQSVLYYIYSKSNLRFSVWETSRVVKEFYSFILLLFSNSYLKHRLKNGTLIEGKLYKAKVEETYG